MNEWMNGLMSGIDPEDFCMIVVEEWWFWKKSVYWKKKS